MWAPCTKLAFGEARKATRSATSSGSQIRPTGIDRVDAHAGLPVLVRHGRGEVDVGGVGDPRGGLPGRRLETVVAHHKDHAAASLLPHAREHGSAGPHIAHKLQVQTAEPLVLRKVFEEATRGATCAGYEDVDPAEGVNRLLYRAFYVFGLAHVARDGHYLLAGRVGQLLRRLFERLFASRGDDHRASLFGEHPGALPADALAGPRDESDRALES